MNAIMTTEKDITVTTRELARVLNCSRQAVHKRAKQEGWQALTQGVTKIWLINSLPKNVQVTVVDTASHKYDQTSLSPFNYELYKGASDKARDKAALKAAFLGTLNTSGMTVKDFCDAYNAGLVNKVLLARLGTVGWQNAYRWLKEAEAGPASLVPKYRSTKGKSRSLDTHMQGLLIEWFCNRNNRSIEHCWRLLQYQVPDKKVSYDSVKRYIQSLPAPYVNWTRKGTHKSEALYQPFIDGNPELYLPMQKVLSDHHCMDFLVERDGNIFRPWITVFMDARTTKLVGWCPSIYPSSLSIAVAFYHMVSQYGAADLIHIDNGKDYRSTVINGSTKTMKVMNPDGIEEEQLVEIQGIFSLCGSAVTFAHAYHGASKGRIERFFGSLEQYVGKAFETYVGSNTVARHEETQLYYRAIFGQAKRPVLITYDDYVQVIGAALAWWNAEWRGDSKGLHGQTPDEAFELYRGPVKPIDPEMLSIAFSTAQVRTVTNRGVRLDGVYYYNDQLFEHHGKQVIARRQINKPDQVLVCDEQGRLLCTAIANYFVESGDLAADNKKVESARKTNKNKIIDFMNQAVKAEHSKSLVDIALTSYPTQLAAPSASASDTSTPIAVGAEDVQLCQDNSEKLFNPFTGEKQ